MHRVLAAYRRFVPVSVRSLVPTRTRRTLRRRLGRFRRSASPTPSGHPTADALIADARAASAQERWADAAEAWQRVVTAGEGPRSTALAQLGRAHRQQGDLEAARRVLERGIADAPEDIPLATEHAQLAVTTRDWPEAVRRWERVVALSGGVPDARTAPRFARALEHLGDHDGAARVLRRAVAHRPGDRDLAVVYARAATDRRSWSDALMRWTAVRVLEGEHPVPRTVAEVARAYQHLGRTERAESVLVDGLAVHDDDVDLATRYAKLATAQRDWPAALQRWERVATMGPPRSEPFIQLARAHQQLGDLDAAEAAIDRGRALLPDRVSLAVWRARLAAAQRDWGTAARRYDDLVAADPARSGPEIHRDRARAHAASDDQDAADDALLVGLAAHPGDPVLLVEQALLALDRSRWDDADRAWKLATADPERILPAGLYIAVARRAAAAFDYARAERVVEEGLRAHPHSRGLHRQFVRNAITEERKERAPEAWDWTGALTRSRAILTEVPGLGTIDDHLDLATELADATALDEAEALLLDAAATHPDDPRLLDELALLALARGRWSDAVDRLERRDAADPDGPRTRTRITLSRAYVALDDHSAASAALDGAPTDADPTALLSERARIAASAGDHERAVHLLEQALASVDDAPLSLRRQLAIARRRAGDHGAARALIGTHGAGGSLETNPGVVAIIGGGPSLRGVDLERLRGRVHAVAVNATASALPWCEVAVTHDASHLTERFRGYPGRVVAGLPLAALEARGRLEGYELRRRLVTDRLSEVDDVLHSGGHTSAHTALNYASLLRPRRVVLFGIDLTDFWGPDEYWHRSMDPYNRRRFEGLETRPTFDRWHEYRSRKLGNAPAVFASTVPQLERAGIEVLNASPDSALTCFPRMSPDEGIARCIEDDLDAAPDR